MAYLANAGFDVFSMDMEGYGRSTRPTVMNDPCNLARAQQALFVPSAHRCAVRARRSRAARRRSRRIGTTSRAVVDYVRALRHVDKINLAGWSQGGPRAGGYAAQHPEKVQKLVLLAPAYARTGPDGAPASRADAVVFNTQSQKEFDANWDRQVGCPDQYDKDVSKAVWSDMVASDPVGGTWGAGVRRAPTVPSWGFNRNVVSKNQTPTLMVAGVHDKQVPPARVRVLRRSRRAGEGVRRSRVLVAQRDVGEEPPAAVPGVARMVPAGDRQRRKDRHAEDRLRQGHEECGLGSRESPPSLRWA